MEVRGLGAVTTAFVQRDGEDGRGEAEDEVLVEVKADSLNRAPDEGAEGVS
ncbi:hypothetical protein [Nonomuraea roseola]|uniref:Uncharacterized protein n=1 Tax=Nonomuraea roseola TaxID=46179 RepID=A0ABV5PWE1_9ACTN